MSLMLRKAAQNILDKHDLDAYHAEIDKESKNLKLVTVCGKPFATVHGVTFNRLQATEAEIEFALELLEAWIFRNITKIDKYHDALAMKDGLGEIPKEFKAGDYTCTCTRDKVYNRKSGNYDTVRDYVVLKNKDSAFNINKEGTLGNFTSSKEFEYPWRTNGLFPTKKLLDEVLEYFTKYLKLRKAIEELDKVHSELNTCST